MTNKEYLEQVYKLDHKIQRMYIRLNEYNRMANSVPGCSFDRERVDHTPSYDAPFEKWVDRALDLEAEIKRQEEKLEKLKEEVIGKIEKVENEDYKTILMMRYIQYKTWDEIAGKIYMCERTARRWHNKALNYIQNP